MLVVLCPVDGRVVCFILCLLLSIILDQRCLAGDAAVRRGAVEHGVDGWCSGS